MLYKFNGSHKVIANTQGTYSIQELEQEIGVYSATIPFVLANGGPIARKLVSTIPEEYIMLARSLHLFINVDIRIHRLYPGDYPAYPGWHCDGEFRETYFSQPDMHRVPVHNHLVATVSSAASGVSNTEFINESMACEVQEPTVGHTLWGQVNAHVESLVGVPTYISKDGELICFDSWTLHRATPARIRGWRLFFRASMWHKANLGAGGKITKQEQVYKLIGQDCGW